MKYNRITKYPDGSSYASVIEEKILTFKINSYEDLWHLNQIVDAQNNLGVTPTITIPCLIDAQADRRFESNQSSGLKLVCKFLNSMNANFRIFHPHNPEVVEALMNNVEIINNSNFIAEALRNLGSKPMNVDDELILMSSDAGGFKPLMKLCDKIQWQGEVFSASKARVKNDNDKFELYQQIDRTDFNSKKILIVDDICVYGGTFKSLSRQLKQRNCGKLYLAVSHMTVQNLGSDPVTNYFDKVFTTNSKYDNYYVGPKTGYTDAPQNLKIIKMF